MPTQELTPNGILDVGSFTPSSTSDIIANLSDGDTGTTVQNATVDEGMVLSMTDLTSDSINNVSQIVLTVGAYTGGKGSADFTVLVELADGTDVISATTFEVSETDVSNEVTATASSLSLTEDNINGIKVQIDTQNETLVVFTDIKIDVTYDRTTVSLGTDGKITHTKGKISLTSGKVSF